MHLLAIGLSLIAPTETPRVVLDRAFESLGGREKLAQIRQLSSKVAGHSYLPEQSERPTGPFLVTYHRGTRKLDFDSGTESGQLTMSGLVYGDIEFPRTFRIENGVSRATPPMENILSQLRVGLGPERILFAAARARDLKVGQDETYNGTVHQSLTFTWDRIPVRIVLRKSDGSPSASEIRLPLPFPWTPWGDCTVRSRWGAWQLLKGGFRLPTHTVTEVNGVVWTDETSISAEVTSGPGSAVAVRAPQLQPEDAKPTLARYRSSAIVPGITQYRGPFNTFVVEQPDGLVVIEPVLSPAFGSAFLDQLKANSPNAKVKAVVATDDAWPHFGGIRSFAARGAELLVLDLNAPLVEQMLKAPFKLVPDELAHHPKRATIRKVGRSLSYGKGANRFTAYPVMGKGSERMMMLYFPEHKLLYGTDLLQKVGDGFFYPAYVEELVNAVKREGLEVETVFGEHLPPTPWREVEAALQKVKG